MKKEENSKNLLKRRKGENTYMVTNKELVRTFIVYLINQAQLEKIIKDLLELKLKVSNSIIRKEIDERIELIYNLKKKLEIRIEKIFYELKRRKITENKIKKMEL